MTLNHQELARRVRERREELGLTREQVRYISKEVDVEVYDGGRRKHPGISERQLQVIETGADVEPRGHTLLMIDAALRWPEGYANSILRGTEPPDAPVALEQRQRASGAASNGPSRSEFERSRSEVADLRVQVADLSEGLNRLSEFVQREMDAVQREVDRILRTLKG